MAEHSEIILQKLDKIQSEITEIKVLDAKQNAQLEAHMKRSDALEHRVEQVDLRVKPLEDVYGKAHVILKMIAVLAALPHAERILRWLLHFLG